jgi:hypothetical protein
VSYDALARQAWHQANQDRKLAQAAYEALGGADELAVWLPTVWQQFEALSGALATPAELTEQLAFIAPTYVPTGVLAEDVLGVIAGNAGAGVDATAFLDALRTWASANAAGGVYTVPAYGGGDVDTDDLGDVLDWVASAVAGGGAGLPELPATVQLAWEPGGLAGDTWTDRVAGAELVQANYTIVNSTVADYVFFDDAGDPVLQHWLTDGASVATVAHAFSAGGLVAVWGLDTAPTSGVHLQMHTNIHLDFAAAGAMQANLGATPFLTTVGELDVPLGLVTAWTYRTGPGIILLSGTPNDLQHPPVPQFTPTAAPGLALGDQVTIGASGVRRLHGLYAYAGSNGGDLAELLYYVACHYQPAVGG